MLSTVAQEADAHFASKNTLLKRNTLLLKSLTHFASKSTLQSHDLLLSTPCSLTPFATQNPLLLITPCFSAHSAPQNTLLLSTLCFKEHFTPRNTLLLRTFYSLAHFAPWNTLILKIFAMPWFTNIPNTFFFEICYSIVQVWVLFHTPISHHGQMNSKDHNVLRSMCVWLPSVLSSWEAKCSLWVKCSLKQTVRQPNDKKTIAGYMISV